MRGAPGRHFLPPEKKSGEFPGSAFSMLQNAICLLSGLAADSLSQTAYESSIPFARSNPTNLWKMGASGIFGRLFGQPAANSVQRLYKPCADPWRNVAAATTYLSGGASVVRRWFRT
jgi:hypothetical protein